MAQGDIISSLNLLTNDMENRILPLNKNTFSKLIQKYSTGKIQDILLSGPLQKYYPVKFQSIDAIRAKGVSGRSGMDANGWRRILSSNNFGTSSSDLRKAFANVVQTLCTDLIDTLAAWYH